MKYDNDQKQAIELAVSGNDLIIEAYAGTGKTTTNFGIAKRCMGKKGVLLTFNKSMSDENAKSAPRNFKCMTPHSLAFRNVGTDYIDRLKNTFNADELKKNLNLSDYDLSTTETNYLLIGAMNRFCSSSISNFDSTIIDTSHIHHLKNENELTELKNRVSCHLSNIWEEMVHVSSSQSITHDFYLKLYCLGKPKIDTDIIMLDEAQDATKSVMNLLKTQECQKIVTGDRFQSIYGWRGCVNGMKNNFIDMKTHLTHSFRFGNEIAMAANYVLSEHNQAEQAGIIGNPLLKSELNANVKPDAIIYRNTFDMIDEVFWSINQGYRPYVIGGIIELYEKINSAMELKNNKTPFGRFYDYEDFEEYLNSVKSGKWLTLSKLLKNYSLESLAKVVYEVFVTKIDESTVLLLSAHKSKGLQFDHVKVSNGFMSPDDRNWNTEEGNLLYVAVTRARLTLNIESSEAFEYEL